MDGQQVIYAFSRESLGLVDAPPEESFDNLTSLASAILDAPVALVSIVEFENDRQYFKSQQGLPEPWAELRQTPLSHSFCQHVVRNDAPLIVENAPQHALVCTNGAVADLNVIAYLGVPIYDTAGEPVGALCVIDGKPREWKDADVTALKQLSVCVSDAIRLKAAVMTSEALRAEQDAFTYAISHDLKAPTNTLQLLLDELFETFGEDADDDTLQLIDLSRQTVERMGQQIEDVLNYIRAIGGEFHDEPVDLQELLADVLDDLKGDLEASGARVTYGALPTVPGSRVQLRVLFQNLAANAIKFRRPKVAPEVTVSPSCDGEFVQVSVKDNGIGISPEYHQKIFKMFQRLHVRKEYPGTGLGLALCQRIAQNHGGKIEVLSEVGAGSEFIVRLPGGAR